MIPRPLERILLVEDDPHLQMVARVTLERVGGFQVRTCSTGAQVLQEAQAFLPDLILMDVMMPDMDGVSALRTLRGAPESAGIAVVFMTAKVQKREIEELKSLGVLDVVSKPFDPMKLPARLLEIWAAKG